MIKSLPTKYNGQMFRSQTEARWAVFFDELKLSWQYEPNGYGLSGKQGTINYRPDFLIQNSEIQYFIEIKGLHPTQEEQDKAEQLAIESGIDVYIFSGTPVFNILHENYGSGGIKFSAAGLVGDGYYFSECSVCGAIGVCYGGYINDLYCHHDDQQIASNTLIKAAQKSKNSNHWNPRGIQT